MARLDPTGPVVLRAPATATVQVHADLAYAHRDQRTLLLDVYAPADQTPASGWPAVLLVHGTTEPTLLRGVRGWGQYTAAGCALAASDDTDQSRRIIRHTLGFLQQRLHEAL
jgi:hypothetical protein